MGLNILKKIAEMSLELLGLLLELLLELLLLLLLLQQQHLDKTRGKIFTRGENF